MVLWLLPIGYALFAMLLLDVAMVGGSAETLVGFSVLGCVLIVVHLLLYGLRRRILSGVFALVEHEVFKRKAATISGDDLESLASLLQGPGASALFDVLPAPLYVLASAFLGWPFLVALALGTLVTALLVLAHRRTLMQNASLSSDAEAQRLSIAAVTRGQGQLLQLAGMRWNLATVQSALTRQLSQNRKAVRELQFRAIGSVAVAIGCTLILVAGLSVWLVILDRARVGTVAAALILAMATLLPLQAIVGRLGEILAQLAASRRLREMLDAPPDTRMQITLPAPVASLDVEGVALVPAGASRPLLHGLSFAVTSGDIVALLGPSGSGKSALLKMLGGTVVPAVGTIRLDGSTLDQWPDEVRARHIGYLPEIPALLPGTVAQNIARFGEAGPDEIMRASLAAGAHDTIVRLPKGYETSVDDPLAPLPLSVLQRIALARAMFGDPFLLLLDNPNAFQDNDGRASLVQSLARARSRGAVCIIAGADSAVIDSANMVLMLRKGGTPDFGTKEEVRERMLARQRLDAEIRAQAAKSAERGDSAGAAPMEQVNVD
jgi:ATP-binding cassette subfamily C protein